MDLDNYPEKKLEQGIYLDFKLLSLRKISTIDYTEYPAYWNHIQELWKTQRGVHGCI